MFPPSLHHFVTETLKKDMVLILNKIDLAPAPLVVAWTHYFLNKYPGLQVLQFTSFPGYNLRGKTEDKSGNLNCKIDLQQGPFTYIELERVSDSLV